MKRIALIHLLSSGCCLQGVAAENVYEADICVYGGTASGICAGLAARHRGQSVIMIEPFRHLGGIAGGGIRIKQDCMYYKDIGGIAKELHDADMALGGSSHMNQWKIRLMLRKKCEDAGIKFFTEHRLDSRDDVVKSGATIEKIFLNYAPVMEEGVPAAKPEKRKVFAVKAKVVIIGNTPLSGFPGST